MTTQDIHDAVWRINQGCTDVRNKLLGERTRVVFFSGPGYKSWPAALQKVIATVALMYRSLETTLCGGDMPIDEFMRPHRIDFPRLFSELSKTLSSMPLLEPLDMTTDDFTLREHNEYMGMFQPLNEQQEPIDPPKALLRMVERSMRITGNGLCVRREGQSQFRTRVSNENIGKIFRKFQEARKEEVLAGIPTNVLQAAKERVNRHEKALYATPQESLAGIAKMGQRFWGWLLHNHPEELLTTGSVSDATVQEALEQWGITELNFLSMVEVHQEQVRKEHEQEVQRACATLTQPTRVTASRRSDEPDQQMTEQASAQAVDSNAITTQQVSQPTGSSQQVTQDEPMEVEAGAATGLQLSIASLLNAAVQIVEENPSATSSVDGAEKRKRKSP